MTAPFNQLSPAEAERLAMLAEEAGEIVQAVGKVLRHGFESRPPAGGRTNGEQLHRELGDLIAVVHGMMWAGDIVEIVELSDAADRWQAKLHYAHHQQDGGSQPVVSFGITPAVLVSKDLSARTSVAAWADRCAAITRAAAAGHRRRSATPVGPRGARSLRFVASLAVGCALLAAGAAHARQDRSTAP